MTTKRPTTRKKIPAMHATREMWLEDAIDRFRERFVALGCELPKTVHVSVGFSIGSAQENANTRAVCWSKAAGTDDANHVFVSPYMEDSYSVLRTLLHELIHVSD